MNAVKRPFVVNSIYPGSKSSSRRRKEEEIDEKKKCGLFIRLEITQNPIHKWRNFMNLLQTLVQNNSKSVKIDSN